MKNNFKVLLLVFGLMLAGWNANAQSTPPRVKVDPITEHDSVRNIAPKLIPNSNEQLALVSSGDSTPTLAKYDMNSDDSKWNIKHTKQRLNICCRFLTESSTSSGSIAATSANQSGLEDSCYRKRN